MKKIICCIHLSWEYVPKLFLTSCFNMWKHSVGKYNLNMLTCAGCYLDKARDNLAKEALKHNPDYILWLDADQTYPGDTPEILMKHIDAGKLVVGGVTPLKRQGEPIDGKPNTWNLDPTTRKAFYREIILNRGLAKVEAMGLGGIMTHPDVFKTLEFPWFQQMWDTDKKYCLSVDLQFYEHCKKAGVDVWCDTDLVYGHMAVRPLELKAKKGMIEF